LPLGAVLEQLFEVVGHGREHHGFVGPGVAAHIEPAQAVMVQQIPEHGLGGALAEAPHPLAAPGLLSLPSPPVRGIVYGAVDLLALGPRRARGLARALLAGAARAPQRFF
jgi:hypothetical protein